MSMIIFSSVLYMAIPLGLISQIFTEIWKDRERILFLKRVRNRMEINDIRPHDVESLFDHCDGDGDEELNLREFKVMLDVIGLKVKGDDAARGFQHFLIGDKLAVTPMHFVRVLWPFELHGITKVTSFRNNGLQGFIERFTGSSDQVATDSGPSVTSLLN